MNYWEPYGNIPNKNEKEGGVGGGTGLIFF